MACTISPKDDCAADWTPGRDEACSRGPPAALARKRPALPTSQAPTTPSSQAGGLPPLQSHSFWGLETPSSVFLVSSPRHPLLLSQRLALMVFIYKYRSRNNAFLYSRRPNPSYFERRNLYIYFFIYITLTDCRRSFVWVFFFSS